VKWLRLENQRYPLRQGETTIGRSPYCSVQLMSLQASREHAAIAVAGDTATLTDLNSRNGTFLNGRKIQEPSRLLVGDKVAIGGLELIVYESASIPDSAANTQENLEVPVGILETTLPALDSAPGRAPRK
jgi:pSer/pThr/pTyr-binding forkhead associated (FHA) protein